MPAMQFWPESSYWSAAFCAAASRSASAKTTKGPLPPSSAVKGTRFRAAAPPTSRPVSEEPVKLTRRTRGWATSAAPASSPIPCTTLNTPAGNPASSVRSARSEQESGAHSGGLRTTVHPAASAGAVFQVESMIGHLLGAAGAVEAGITSLVVQRGVMPRTSV